MHTRCSQCGQPFTARACGPTHAVIASEQYVASGLESHPTIEAECERHQRWCHTCYEITGNDSSHREYLCSCGISFTVERFGEPAPALPPPDVGPYEVRDDWSSV